MISGTGGLRKYRISFPGKGKSGGGRVAYVDFSAYETIYLITVYSKSKKDDLSKKERECISKMINILKGGFKNQEIEK